MACHVASSHYDWMIDCPPFSGSGTITQEFINIILACEIFNLFVFPRLIPSRPLFLFAGDSASKAFNVKVCASSVVFIFAHLLSANNIQHGMDDIHNVDMNHSKVPF